MELPASRIRAAFGRQGSRGRKGGQPKAAGSRPVYPAPTRALRLRIATRFFRTSLRASMTTLTPDELAPAIAELSAANRVFLARYPGETDRRQPVHVVYGGAHLFKADTRRAGSGRLRVAFAARIRARSRRVGGRRSARRGTPDFAADLSTAASAPSWSASRSRISGWTSRTATATGPTHEEDGHAASSAGEVAAGMAAGTLPPFSASASNLSTRTCARAPCARWISSSRRSWRRPAAKLPANFVITIPKVQIAAHVAAAAQVCALLETRLGLPAGALRLELMVETPQSIIDGDGPVPAAGFCRGGGRALRERAFRRVRLHGVVRDHGGVPGDGASGVRFRAHGDGRRAGGHRHADFRWRDEHPAGRPARGATGFPTSNAAKIARPSTARGGWRSTTRCTRCATGFTRDGTCIPRNSSPRYAAVYSFFLAGLPAASGRLKAFVEKAALASLFGDVFDDAATGQGLLNFFLRGIACGAITEERGPGDRADAGGNPHAFVPENPARPAEGVRRDARWASQPDGRARSTRPSQSPTRHAASRGIAASPLKRADRAAASLARRPRPGAAMQTPARIHAAGSSTCVQKYRSASITPAL